MIANRTVLLLGCLMALTSPLAACGASDASSSEPPETSAATGDTTGDTTGDVVFAGAIGRIDLPGGDAAAMADTLRAFATLPDVPIYPGHGPASRVSHELRTNPFL